MQRTGKIRLITAALAAVFVLGLTAGVYARDIITTLEVRYRDIKVTVDGKTVVSDTEPFVVLDEGRVYLGARALAEALGAEVDWDDDTSTVIVHSNQSHSETRSGDQIIYENRQHGFSLTVPGTWQKVDSPAVAVAYADPVTGSNMNVAVSQAEAGQTLDAQTDAVINTIKTLFKVDSVSEKTVTNVAGHSARRFELTLTADGNAIRQQTYVLVASGKLYVLSFSASNSQYANFQTTFEAIRASVGVN